MAPRTSLALFLSLNLLCFTYTTATCSKCIPTPTTPTTPTTPPTPTTPSTGTCPRDALQIAACVNVLNLVDLTLGSPPVQPCCSLIQGLADLEAAVCLCTSLKAKILGIINLNLPINLSVLLNVCSRTAPKNFQCA